VHWDYNLGDGVIKELEKLGHEPAKKILKFLDKRIYGATDPRQFGKRLKGELGEYWSYRVQDFRILCELKDETFIVLVVKVGHRRDVYD